MAKPTKKVVKRAGRKAVTEEEVPTPEHLRQGEDPDAEPEIEDETPPDEPDVIEPDVPDEPDDDSDDEDDDDIEPDDNPVPTVQVETTEEGFQQKFFPSMPGDGIVIGEGDPVHVEGVLIGNEIHLTKPTYRAVIPYRSIRHTFLVVHHLGAVVHKDNVGSFTAINEGV